MMPLQGSHRWKAWDVSIWNVWSCVTCEQKQRYILIGPVRRVDYELGWGVASARDLGTVPGRLLNIILALPWFRI